MRLLNGLIGTLILIAIYILPIAISIVVAVWVYHAVNRANATFELKASGTNCVVSPLP